MDIAPDFSVLAVAVVGAGVFALAPYLFVRLISRVANRGS